MCEWAVLALAARAEDVAPRKAPVANEPVTITTRATSENATLIHLFQSINVVQIRRIHNLYYCSRTKCKIHLFLNRKCHNFLRKGGIYWLKCYCISGAENTGSYSWLGSASLF